MTNIFLISDLHFGGNIHKPVQTMIDRIIGHINVNEKNVILVAGDITDHGYDGISTCQCFFPCFGSNSGITGGSKVNELNMFQTEFLERFKYLTNTYIYFIHGNHDLYNGAGRYPVLDYIKSKFGNTYYSFVVNGIVFFMCGLYPDASICNWIKTEFIEKQVNDKTPLIFCFHYSMDSTWWKEEKTIFLNTINAKNILGILVGHVHESYIDEYLGIKTLNGSGAKSGYLRVFPDSSRQVLLI